MKYSDAGVDVELGDTASEIMYNAARLTWDNRKGRFGELFVPHDDFGGIRGMYASGLPEGTLIGSGSDGIGTKVEFAERTGNHRTMAYNLFAMVCDDAVRRGAEPVLFNSILDVNSLGNEDETHIQEVRQIALGYIAAARDARVFVIDGEVAELGDRVNGYGKFNYNWGGTVVWFAKRDRIFTGDEIQEGDSLVGLEEPGFRSNGISLVRLIMRENLGENWHNLIWGSGEKTLGDLALTPSRIYTPTVVDMFGGYDGEPKVEVHGVANITGGGLPGKLGRILKPSGLGATVHSPMEPTGFMRYVQALGAVSDEEAYKTWNMRHGMVVITPNPTEVKVIAKERGIPSRTIGEVTRAPGIRIRNRGVFSQSGGSIRAKGPEVLVFD